MSNCKQSERNWKLNVPYNLPFFFSLSLRVPLHTWALALNVFPYIHTHTTQRELLDVIAFAFACIVRTTIHLVCIGMVVANPDLMSCLIWMDSTFITCPRTQCLLSLTTQFFKLTTQHLYCSSYYKWCGIFVLSFEKIVETSTWIKKKKNRSRKLYVHWQRDRKIECKRERETHTSSVRNCVLEHVTELYVNATSS